MRTLFTDPDEFFAERAPEPTVKYPVAVVLLVGFVDVLASIPVLQMTIRAMPGAPGTFSSLAYVSGIVGGFVGALLVWVAHAGAFHIISDVVYDGSGSFRDTLAVTGWGFVPAIFAGLVSAVVAFVVFGDATVSGVSGAGEVQAFVEELQNRPEFLLASVLGIVFLLWQGVLWAFGVMHVRDLTLREAGITVAIPVTIALLFRLFGMVT